jgi:hypothetical protein
MKTTLEVQHELLEEFQKAVVKEHGKLKGAQSKALCEAIKLWLAFRGRARFFAVVSSNEVQVAKWEEVKDKLVCELRQGRVPMGETAILPLFDTFNKDELKDMLDAVISALGEPDETEGLLEELNHPEDQAVFVWRLKEGKEGYGLRLTLRMSLSFVGYSRLWSKNVMSVKDLQLRSEELV